MRSSMFSRAVGLAGLLSLAWMTPASAQIELFRGDPSFTWNQTNLDWAVASGGSPSVPWNNLVETRAVFEGTAASATATLGEPITAHSLRFSTATNWTVTGSTLTLAGAAAGAGTIEATTGVVTINSILAGNVGLTKTGAGILQIGTASTYTGTTTISAGTFRPNFVNNVFNPTGAYVLANAAGVVFSLANTTQSIGSLAGGGTTGGTVTLGNGTLTVGGDNTSTTYAGTIQNAGTLVKTGTGTLTLTANSTNWTGPLTLNGGVVSITSATVLNTAATTAVTLDGGTLRNTNATNGGRFIGTAGTARPIVVGTNGGAVDVSTSGVALIYEGTISGTGNTLTKTGAGEFRFQGANTATASFSKLVVTQGLFRLGNVAGNNFETGFGAAPAAPLADAITLNGGSIGTSFGVTLNANRGITLGASGGGVNTGGGSMVIPGVITGSGALNATNTNVAANALALTLTGANTYTGGTTVGGTVNSTLIVNNTTGSGTGTGAVTVNSGATLRGTGSVTGPLIVSSGATFTPGAAADKIFNAGSTVAIDGTFVATLFGTGTGDQAQLISGGAVTLGGASTLRLALDSVTVAALRTAVGEGNSRTYTVIDSGATNVNNLFTTTDFTTAGFNASEWQVLYNQGGGNVQLVFTPVPEPASMLAVAAAGLGAFEWRRRRRKLAQDAAATVTV